MIISIPSLKAKLKMKYLFLILFFTVNLIAQENESKKDTTATNSDRSLFIEDYNNQLNIKFDVSNEIENYYIPFDQGILNIRPNLGINYALVFNYRFVSLRLGIRPKPSSESIENKGKTNSFRMSIKFLFDKWNHQFEYNYIEGYYVNNSTDIFSELSGSDSNRHVQFPSLTTSIFSGSSLYKINKNYSLKATESQTEVQLKSIGTFMPRIDYRIYSIYGSELFINKQGEEIQRDHYNTYLGLNTVFNIGYYYTFVHKKNWYLNLFAIPGIGFDLYENTKVTMEDTSDNTYFDLLISFQTGAGLGYNSKRYYFGTEYNHRLTNDKYDGERIQFYTTKNEFHIFIGYRFKAPKSIRKSVDMIEEKVPMLNDRKKK